MKRAEQFIENSIFSLRWAQLPVYLGLGIASVFYSYKFILELIHLIAEGTAMPEALFMLSVLTLIDISMVINLLIIVILGGYSTFVSKMNLNNHEDKPEWLDKMNAGTLKVKLAVSLVGVSGVHLLKVFVNINNYTTDKIILQVVIHFVFLLSALMLAYTDKILHSK